MDGEKKSLSDLQEELDEGENESEWSMDEFDQLGKESDDTEREVSKVTQLATMHKCGPVCLHPV